LINSVSDRNRICLIQESLLREQHTILSRVLEEQERIREQRLAFQVQRDRDVLKLRQEAVELEEKANHAQCIVVINLYSKMNVF
jgi:hypothetical protein